MRSDQISTNSASRNRVLMNRDVKNEKDLHLNSLAARSLLSSLPNNGSQLNGMMNDYPTISALSAAMMNSLPASCLPPSALFNCNNSALNSTTASSIASSLAAAAVANLNNNFQAAVAANQSGQSANQSSPSTTPINVNQNNTTPPNNLNTFNLSNLDQAVNYHLQHPSSYMQW